MQKLSEAALAAIGRMTVAATDVEHALAELTDPALFARPGEPLRAARATEFPADLRRWVESAATQLLQSQAALRVMWQEGGRTDPAMFDEITARLLRCCAALANELPAAGRPA